MGKISKVLILGKNLCFSLKCMQIIESLKTMIRICLWFYLKRKVVKFNLFTLSNEDFLRKIHIYEKCQYKFELFDVADDLICNCYAPIGICIPNGIFQNVL